MAIRSLKESICLNMLNIPYLFVLRGFLDKGQIEGEIKINFDAKGKIKDDYIVTG